jgi:hypothetical protein
MFCLKNLKNYKQPFCTRFYLCPEIVCYIIIIIDVHTNNTNIITSTITYNGIFWFF